MEINRILHLIFVAAGLLLLTAATSRAETTWKAGTARAVITPTERMWLAGFASRTNPATGGKLMDLWIKALALEDATGHRAVILTADLLGIPQNVYQHACAAIGKKYALQPEQILLCASHTHCGPVLRTALYDIYTLDETQRQAIEKYTDRLEAQMVEVTGAAIGNLEPVRITSGQGASAFAVNRRSNSEPKVSQIIAAGELKGPVDHSVPVLAVYAADGHLKTVLFGYACHNTTLQLDEWSGDYAGFAQIALEKNHPGAQAMFFMGCGGDQNPLPRHEIYLSQRYGNMLAAAVEEVLVAPPHNLAPELVTKMKMVTLPFGSPLTVAELEALKSDPQPPTRRWATRWLDFLNSGKTPPSDYPFPMQAWQFGGQQLLLTLGGEPVVDYAILFKQWFGPKTWVAGYCNDVMTYIPSQRVLREDEVTKPGARWGYEGSYCFVVYGLPAKRWGEKVEDIIGSAAKELVGQFKK
ncbi:MAG: neutral/alkaline non-lysosomal ceramidase N-terminal domain-containing protein [Verrucomicrobiota bacterium]